MHTIRRDPQEWRRLIPPAARKLRLVYSTACHGAHEERAAWEGVGARTVVTHLGINNPLVAEPYVLTKWLAGEPIGAVVAAAWRETTLFVRMGLTLPGVRVRPSDVPFLEGSRPVISGDAALTITRGACRVRPLPAALTYDRARGGPLGLALRVLAGRYAVRGRDALALLDLAKLPLPIASELLQLEWLYVEQPGVIVIRLAAPQEIPLRAGARLLLDRELRLAPGAWDPVARKVELHVEGLRVAYGLLQARPTQVTVLPEPGALPGYRLRLQGRLGLIPLWGSLYVGGSDPTRAGIPAPVLQPRDGLAGSISR